MRQVHRPLVYVSQIVRGFRIIVFHVFTYTHACLFACSGRAFYYCCAVLHVVQHSCCIKMCLATGASIWTGITNQR